MAGSSKRRMVKRLLFGALVPFLLFWAYLASYLLLVWAAGNGPQTYAGVLLNRTRPAWEPIELYCCRRLPLGVEFMTFKLWVYNGGREPIGECRSFAEEFINADMRFP